MNIEVNAREEESPVGESQDIGLMVDTQIMRLLGVRFEIVDDIIRTWPNDVVPDDTNWLLGERFSMNFAESMNILGALKVQTEFFEDNGYHWAVITFGDEGELQTQEAVTKELAGAFAAFAALYGRRGL